MSKRRAPCVRAGYIEKLGAGIYTMLPLGLRVLNRVATIIREEMEKSTLRAFMPAMHPKEVDSNWALGNGKRGNVSISRQSWSCVGAWVYA